MGSRSVQEIFVLPRLGAVPGPRTASSLARQIQASAPTLRRAPEKLIASLGWSLRSERMDASIGGVRALLIPLRRGGFTLVVDPDPSPDELKRGVPPNVIRAWRIAHELAHTFFYSLGSPPRRRIPLSDAEEHFCDAVASALVPSWRCSRLGRVA